MRVIAGSARSLPLRTIDGNGTRPTTDRIKETLFNIIQGEIPGCYFLDLFAGSGAIGIEALSRGAEYACFVEQNRQAPEFQKPRDAEDAEWNIRFINRESAFFCAPFRSKIRRLLCAGATIRACGKTIFTESLSHWKGRKPITGM